MKTFVFAASLLALASTAMTAATTATAADVGVSITVGQPGFYGRIDLGDFGQPRVVYAEPLIINRPLRYVEQQPIYLRVPPGHAKNWSKHCGRYNACGQRVLFVDDNWYQNDFSPRYREQHARMDNRQEQRRDDRRDDRGEDQRDDRHDNRGNGHGNGHGKGHGKD